jgi:dihydroorotase
LSHGFPALLQRFTLEKTPSQSMMLEKPVGQITPLPLGVGLEMTWWLAEWFVG